MIILEGIVRDFSVGDSVVHALRDINLTITPGDYISLMGPSGSGKSTLLHILGLLDRPSQGSYHLNGTLVSELDENTLAKTRRERIGFVFQFFHLIPRLTAADNVALPLTLAGIEPDVRKEKVTRALQQLGLSDRADHRPDQLSGGQRQRVAIARAMITEPEMILADEPTGNLDRASGHEVIETLELLNREKGITLIVVTHDPEIGKRARRQIHMIDGRIEEDVQK
ncbi:MAG: ABC transporter ATP-binding protein [Gammaproteobacteria bacterium]|nr:ABC transporter ATP-binding protein [Gammaproteobacteria bacterium]